jgi:hypothetical protein
MNQNNLSLEDWRLIQDCIVDKIFTLRARDNFSYEDVVDQLEIVLDKIRVKGLTPRV